MAEPQKTYIFHIRRKDGSSLFLHPLSAPAKVVETLEKGPLEGRYGREPPVEALSSFRDELYRQVEAGVRHWLNDLRFIPKFLIASGVFVVTYVFFSAVVRDPIPVIDEAVLGLAAAVISFVLMGRRDLASRRGTKKRLDLRMVVDRIAFRESDFVKNVERALHSVEAESAEQVVRRIVQPVQQELESVLPASERAASMTEAAQFVRLLEQRFNFRKLQREERAIRRLARRREASRVLEARHYDFPLYAIYKSFKRTVSGRR
jgi:hypothetical protein